MTEIVDRENMDSDTDQNILYSSESIINRVNDAGTRRNLVGFWILGLCNNFAYVIMLSAANDILKPHSHNDSSIDLNLFNTTDVVHLGGPRIPVCHRIGTGAILLADIIPSFLIKLFGSFAIQSITYKYRVIAVIFFSAISYPIVSFAPSITVSIIGVAFASLAGGLGELSFMGMLSKFDKNCVSTWSSGTGAAGLLGALSYALLTSVCHMTPQHTILLMLIVPVCMFASYFFLLVKPSDDHPDLVVAAALTNTEAEAELLMPPEENRTAPGDDVTINKFQPSLLAKLLHIRYLMKYMIPLTLVYFSEYLINQSLFELIYFDVTWISVAEQYRWYQVLYQLGVFISRSSVNLFKIRCLYTMSLLQSVNFVLLLAHVLSPFLGSVWLIFAIILYEGLLGGATYVNTFYMIRNEEDAKWKEFSMGTVCIADAAGIVMSGIIAVPLHNYLCTL